MRYKMQVAIYILYPYVASKLFGHRPRIGWDAATCGLIKSKMAADGHHRGYTKMAITSQPVCRST